MKSDRVQARIQKLPGWRTTNGEKAITRTYEFPNFRAAIAFVAYVAEVAEAADHHPDIDIRYRKVTLHLSTHSEGGVTEKDFEMAESLG